jgi:hypothetical protein
MNDAADAEAIAEAASRATMRFVPVKSAAKQGACMVFKARDLLVRQRTQTLNALHEHLAEYGVIAPQGLAHLSRLATAMDDAKGKLPAVVIALCAMLIEHIACLGRQIAILDKELRNRARRDELAKRLMTIPVGKVIHAILDNYATHKNSKVQALAGQSSALGFPIHPDIGVLAQRGRELLLGHHPQADPARRLQIGRRVGGSYPPLYPGPQSARPAIGLLASSHARAICEGVASFFAA